MKHTFYLAYPKAESSPIILSLRDKNKRITISTGISINPKDWDAESQRLKPKAKDARLHNANLAESERAIKRAIAYGELDKLSIEEIANAYRREMGLEIKEVKRKDLFLPFFQMWATTSFGKHKANRQTLYHYRTFAEFSGKLEIGFDDVNYNLYIKYLSWLQKQGYKTNMQGLFIKSLKAAMNEAYKRELHDNRAYQNFEKPSEQVVTVALTKEEVDLVYNAELGDAGFCKARDLFIIGCYTGMRFSDYSRLTAEDADKEFLTKIQQKTKNEVCIPLHPRVREILRKWGGSPKITQQKMNLYIKTICAQVGINSIVEVQEDGKIKQKQKWELVSTHTARRTAATNLLLSGASIYEVQKFLGHNAVRQTETYLRISAQETARRIADNKFFTEE